MYAAVSGKDLRIVVKKLLEQAQAGDTAAAKLILAYTLGEPQPIDVLERLGAIEALMEGMADG
jgi:hypothetical protein